MATNDISLKISIDDNGDFDVVVKKAKKTAQAVDGVTESTDKLGKSTDKLSNKRNRYSKQEKGAAGATSNSTKAFAKMNQTIGSGGAGLVGAYATLAASIFAITAAFGVLKRAAAFRQLEEGLIATGNAAGTNLPKVAEGLREITGEAISLKEAMTSVALGVSAGFSTEQMEGLTKVAKGASLALGRDMADAMSRLTRGAAKLEPEILDELGIMVRLDTATQEYAASLGRTAADLSQFERRMAFTNAIIEQGEKKFSLITATIEANPFDKLSATFADLTQDVLEFGLVLAPIVNLLASSPTALLGVLAMFGSTLIKKIVPALSEVSAASAKAAAEAQKAVVESNSKQLASYKKLQSEFSKGSLAAKSVKDIEKGMEKGTASMKDMNKYHKKLQVQIKGRETRLANSRANHTAEYIAGKEAEIAKLKEQERQVLQMMKLKPQIDTEKGSGLRGYSKKTADSVTEGKAALAKISAGAFAEMEKNAELGGFKSIIANFKVLKTSALSSFAAIGKGSTVFAKINIGARAAAVGVRLLGTAFLQAIPFIGQVILGLSLLWEFISPLFEAGKIAKEVDEVVESFDSLNAIGTQLAVTLRSDASELDKFKAQLKTSVGAMGQLESGLNKIRTAQQESINEDIIEHYKELDHMRSNFAANSDPFESMMTGVNDGLEREIQALQRQKDIITKESAKGIIKAQIAFEAMASSAGLLTEATRAQLESLRQEVQAGDTTWDEYQAKLEEIAGPAKTLMGNMENIKGAMTGLRNAIKTLSGETDNPFKDILGSLSELNSGFAQAARVGVEEFEKYGQEVIASDEKLAKLLETAGDGNMGAGALLLAANMKKYGEEIQNATTKARTQGYIMAANRAAAKTSTKAALAYAKAQNQQITEQIIGLKANLKAKEETNATDNERMAITQQIIALESGRVDPLLAVAAVEKKILEDKQKALIKEEKALTKVLEQKKAAITLDLQLIEGQAKLLDLTADIHKEQALANNLRAGGSGKTSAEAELKAFEEQKTARMAIAEKEAEIKINTIEIEYELLRQRVQVALQEAALKTHDIEDKERGLEAAMKLVEASQKQLDLLTDAEALATAQVKKQLELNKIRLDNKGLIAQYKANKESLEITKENTKIIQNSMKAELDGRSELLAMAKEQSDIQAEYAKALAVNANLLAGGSGTISAKKEYSIWLDQQKDRESLANLEKQIKIETLDLEYDLLAFRLQVAEDERNQKIADAPDSKKAGMRAATPNYSKLLEDMDNVRTKSKQLLESEEKLQKLRNDNEGLVLQLKIRDEILAKDKKAAEWKQDQLALENKLLGLMKEQQALTAATALEGAKLESFASGTGGEISAQKEFELWKAQEEQKKGLLKQEHDMRIMLIELEFMLLRQKIEFAEREAIAALSEMPTSNPMEIDAKETAVMGVSSEFTAYKEGLTEAEILSKSIADNAFNVENMALFNEGLALANASSRDLYDNLSEAVDAISDPGIAQIGQSIIEAFAGGDEILSNRRALEDELVQLRQDGLAKQKAANMHAIKGEKKLEEKALKDQAAINKKANAKQATLDKSAGAAKMQMASTVATGIGGILSGLAATQDTSSKEGFESAKKMQYAAAIVNTAGAIAAANAIGPPQSIPAMAFAAAAGAIQIATIASTSYEGGGGGAPSAPSGSASAGGGAGSSTQGQYGQSADTQRMDKSRSLKDMIDLSSLQLLAKNSENAAWAIHKVSQSFGSIGEAFKKDSLSSIEILKQNLKYVVDNYKRKSYLGFKLDSDKMNFSAYREKGAGIADKIVPAMNAVLADVRKEVQKTASGLNLDIDMSKVQIDLNYWSKRMGVDFEGRLKGYENMIAAYANAVAATIPGLKDIKDATKGDFEEFQRLVGGLQLVNDAFAMVGNSANTLAANLENADMAANFVELLGGEDSFTEAMTLYSNVVLTEAQRLEGMQLNAQKNIESIAGRYNTVIADSPGITGLEEFKITATMDQKDFKAIFEGLSRNMSSDNIDIRQTATELMGGLMETLPYYEKLWEAEEALADEVDSMVNNLRTLNDLEVDLMETQGYAYNAMIASRELERAELNQLQGEYSDQIRATQELIWAHQDLNAQFNTGMDLLKRVGLAEEAVRLERAKQLMGMDPRLQRNQELIWAAEDAAMAEKKAIKERTEAMGVLTKSYKQHTDAIKEQFNTWADEMKDKIKESEDNVGILSSAIDSLTTAGDTMRRTSKESVKASREEIKAITARVKAGEYDSLADADKDLGVLTADNSDLYGSFAEFSLAQAQSAAAIHNLKTASSEALTTEEATLNTLTNTLEYETTAHEAEMALLQQEFDQLKGLNDNITTWEQAKMDFAKADRAVAMETAKVEAIKAEVQQSTLNQMSEQLTGLSYLETIDMSLQDLAALARGENPSATLTTDTFSDPTTTGGLTNSGTSTVDLGTQYVATTPDPVPAPAPAPTTTTSYKEPEGILARVVANFLGDESKLSSSSYNTSQVQSQIGALSSFTGYASGGNHPGGLRMVGEQGPELEYTGPSKIYSNPDTKAFFDTTKLEKEMKEMRRELSEAQQEMVKHAKDTAKLLNRWDGDGMPLEREV